jgi:RHS repeat-associated protein
VTRDIAGISGGLKAIQTNGEAPVLQLSDLHGDTIATVGLAETETKLLSTSDTTEFGVPRTSSPPRYNYLGADELPTELASGVINMGARTYVPALGRLEQTDPQPGGSGNAYTYTHNDPVNQADPSGEWTNTVTYDYEAAETGASQGLAETYTGPGAILPPPVNAQIEAEFVAHPPWDAVAADKSAIEEEGSYTGGGGLSNFFRIHGDLDDHTPDIESQCNKTGQNCSGHRGGGHSSNEGVKNACDVVGVSISLISIVNIPSDIIRGILGGGGASVTALCRQIG